jgi:hypothetical protein
VGGVSVLPPVATAPHRHMGTMNCLACGHDNRAGEESCVSCSASLHLKLCGTCEAINAEQAAACHNCGAHFGAAAGRVEALPARRSLPSTWLISVESGGRRSGLRAALWIVPVLAVAAFGLYSALPGVPVAQAVTVADPVALPAPAVVEPKIIEPKVAPEAPRTPASKVIPRVTHTRGADSASAGGGSVQ